jgi:CRISPR-associated protein Csd2
MARGFYNPFHAVSYPSGTGVTEHDLAVFWGSLIEGWQNNRSAHRTGVNLRRLYVFDHPTMRGVEQSHITAARVSVVPRSGMHTAWSDYTITVNDSGMPEGMLLYTWADDAALGTLASYPIATAK